MHFIAEYAVASKEHGIVSRETTPEIARQCAEQMGIAQFGIQEEQRPAAAVGFAVAAGGLARTWELLVDVVPNPEQGIYPITESAALAMGLGGGSPMLRGYDNTTAIATLVSELTHLPELVGQAVTNKTHNKAFSVANYAAQAIAAAAGCSMKTWREEAYGPAIEKLLKERNARMRYRAF